MAQNIFHTVKITHVSDYEGPELIVDAHQDYSATQRMGAVQTIRETLELRESSVLDHRPAGLWYSITLLGPVLTKTGKPHATQRDTVTFDGIDAADRVPLWVTPYLMGPAALAANLTAKVMDSPTV